MTSKKQLGSIRWYHATRALGIFLVLYGVLGDSTPERGTLILGGLGLLGFDSVKRSDASKQPPSEKADDSAKE
jgi:hypothetical protein